jgi:uncharacterized protein with HEPN domain
LNHVVPKRQHKDFAATLKQQIQLHFYCVTNHGRSEAATKLPETFKDQHQQINWHRIKVMRNRMAHDYRNVNISIVWETIEMDLAELKKQVLLIL